MWREKMAFIALKSFNNNVVYCTDSVKNKKCILIGKGIGYGVNGHNEIIGSKIDNTFYLYNSSNSEKFEGITKEVDKNIVGVTEEVIAMINKEVNADLDEKIHVTFMDHVIFAIERYKNGIDIKNPFIVETKILYKMEYEIASKALKIINERLNINLPDDEIGLIAMHIHAAIKKQEVSKTSLNTVIISEMVAFIEEDIEYTIDKNSMDYARLVTHLRFALERAHKDIPIENLLLGTIKRKFKDSYSISKKVSDKIKMDFNISLSQDEIGYLAIHLENLKLKKKD
jgi:transcriptional antiterminator